MQVYTQHFFGKAVVVTTLPQEALSMWHQITALATLDHVQYLHAADIPNIFEYRLTLKPLNTLMAV